MDLYPLQPQALPLPLSDSQNCPQALCLVQRLVGFEAGADKTECVTVQFFLPLPWVSPT